MKHNLKSKMKGLRRAASMLLLLLTFSTLQGFAQKVTITGVVKDASGEIPGVNVLVQGTSIGTITDVMGKYSIAVENPEKTVLEFRFIGYQTQAIKVGNRKVIDVDLKEDSEVIDDVVIVGYGSQKKKSVVGAITQAKGEELLQAGSVTTISEALTGLLPGVSTMQASGQPGASSADILIRGRGTWSTSTPLFLVDGVQRDFNDIDPNEVESISVLKDASATAVYGVNGANGVVLVTTKTGKIGKAKIKFSANWGLKDPTMETDYATDYATNLEYFNQAKVNDKDYSSLFPQWYIDRWRDPAYADNPYYQYTSFINDLIGQGETQQYNLNISGGNKFVKYFTSLGYQYDGDNFELEKQPEFDPRTYQKRFNWRTNLDFNLTKSTTFKVKLAGDFTNWNGNPMTKEASKGFSDVGGSLMQRLFSTAMISVPAQFEDGRLGIEPGAAVNPNYLGRLGYEGSSQKKSSKLWTDFVLEQEIVKGLKASAKFSYDQYSNYEQGVEKAWNASPVYYYIQSSDGLSPDYDEDGNMIIKPWDKQIDDWENPANLSKEEIEKYNKNIYYEVKLFYDKVINKHAFTLMGLFQRSGKQNKVAFTKPSEDWVGRVTYAYNDKYLLDVSGAYNGNTYFSPEKRYGFFPSGAIGWVLSEENFFKENIGFIDFAKIKYSYGEVGSKGDVKDFQYLSFYTYKQQPMEYGYLPNITGGNNGAGLPMYTEGSPASPDVTWETSIKQNLGIEVNMLNNRFKTAIDLFQEDRRDILMKRRTIPIWYGNEFPWDNLGQVKNHGVEVELNWNDKIGADFNYWLKGNISLSENRIVAKDDPKATPEYRMEAGKPIGWTSGLYQTGQSQNWDDIYSYAGTSLVSTLIPGDFAYNDYNADGTIDLNDKVPIGNPSYATKTYTFSFGFDYKNFSLVAMFNGMFDISKSISNSYLYPYETSSTIKYMMKNNETKNAWTPLNTDTSVPVLHTSSSNYYSQKSTYSYRNASFLRLRNIELKYRLPKQFLDKSNVFNSFELYVNGNNLHTWQKLPKSFDPEAKKLEVYPITKRYNVGVRLSL